MSRERPQRSTWATWRAGRGAERARGARGEGRTSRDMAWPGHISSSGLSSVNQPCRAPQGEEGEAEAEAEAEAEVSAGQGSSHLLEHLHRAASLCHSAGAARDGPGRALHRGRVHLPPLACAGARATGAKVAKSFENLSDDVRVERDLPDVERICHKLGLWGCSLSPREKGQAGHFCPAYASRNPCSFNPRKTSKKDKSMKGPEFFGCSSYDAEPFCNGD